MDNSVSRQDEPNLALSIPAVSYQKHFSESYFINPLIDQAYNKDSINATVENVHIHVTTLSLSLIVKSCTKCKYTWSTPGMSFFLHGLEVCY